MNLWVTISGKGTRRVAIFDMEQIDTTFGRCMPPKVAHFDYLHADHSRVPDSVLVGAALDAFLGEYKWDIRKGDVPNLWMVS